MTRFLSVVVLAAVFGLAGCSQWAPCSTCGCGQGGCGWGGGYATAPAVMPQPTYGPTAGAGYTAAPATGGYSAPASGSYATPTSGTTVPSSSLPSTVR